MIVHHALESDRHPIPIFSFPDAASIKQSLKRSDRLRLQDVAADLLSCIVLCHELEFSGARTYKFREKSSSGPSPG